MTHGAAPLPRSLSSFRSHGHARESVPLARARHAMLGEPGYQRAARYPELFCRARLVSGASIQLFDDLAPFGFFRRQLRISTRSLRRPIDWRIFLGMSWAGEP